MEKYKWGDMMKVLILGGALNHEGADSAFAKLTSQTDDDFIFNRDDLTDEELAEVEVILGSAPGVLERIFSLPSSNLKWIQAFSAGVDYYPLEQLAKRKILLSNVSGIHAEPIAETVFGLILGQLRGIKAAVENQQHSNWDPDSSHYMVLSGKKLAVFGTGHIGTRVAELGRAFKMETIGVNHSGHRATGFEQTEAINELGPAVLNADVIVNTLPLTRKTHSLYDSAFFAKLTAAPLFISIDRGPSVVTEDLIKALNDGQVGAAGLDVTDPEPLPSDSPLWHMKNVTITPHVSGLYQEYVRDVVHIFKENLYQYKKDGTLARNEVDMKKGY